MKTYAAIDSSHILSLDVTLKIPKMGLHINLLYGDDSWFSNMYLICYNFTCFQMWWSCVCFIKAKLKAVLSGFAQYAIWSLNIARGWFCYHIGTILSSIYIILLMCFLSYTLGITRGKYLRYTVYWMFWVPQTKGKIIRVLHKAF